MSLTRTLRMMRWAPLAAVVAVAACEHGDVNQLITLDGDTLIVNIAMSTQFSGGTPAGSRTANRFLLTAFDTSVYDAFGRQSASVPKFVLDPNGFYGAAAGRELYYGAAGATVDSFTPDNRLLPAVVNVGQYSYGALYGAGRPVTYIVQGGHAGNGANTSWEFWYVIRNLAPSTRYILGLARYGLRVNGALDHTELLLTGAVTQPDSLVFMANDFRPGGNKANDNGFILDCSDPAEGRPTDGANPFFIAGKTSGAAGTSQRIIIDHTICSDNSTVWTNGFNSSGSPVPLNNRVVGLGRNQYNFLVVWEALPDSTPNYAKPVWREQLAQLMSTTGELINNAAAPIPTAALTPTAMALLPGADARPESLTVDITNLAPLSNASYQIWFAEAGAGSATLAAGRFYRIRGGAIVDSITSTSSFDGDTTTGTTLRMKIDYGPIAALGTFDNVVLAIAPAGGGATLPTSQPMWGTILKTAGNPGLLVRGLTFGNFDAGGAALARWGPDGNGRGGVFGRALSVELNTLPRPPVGFYYNAYLRNDASGAIRDLGAILSPFPDYQSLVDADVNTGGTVTSAQIVSAAVRVDAQTDTELCAFNRIDVRLEPKAKAPGILPVTVTLSGTSPYPSLLRCQP